MRQAALLLFVAVAVAGCGSSYEGPKLVFSGSEKTTVHGQATCAHLAGRLDVDMRLNKGDISDFTVLVPRAGTYTRRSGRDGLAEINTLGSPDYQFDPYEGNGSGMLRVNADENGAIDATLVGINGTKGSVQVRGAWACATTLPYS